MFLFCRDKKGSGICRYEFCIFLSLPMHGVIMSGTLKGHYDVCFYHTECKMKGAKNLSSAQIMYMICVHIQKNVYIQLLIKMAAIQ